MNTLGPQLSPCRIPNRLVFVWLGAKFPLTHLVAMRSARAHCRPEEMLLIADRLERRDPALAEFGSWSGFRVVTPEEVLGAQLPGLGRNAMELYGKLDAPAARANLLRLAELWRRGGVYMDTDTITLKDLAPLRTHTGFCGLERLALPREVVQSRRPWPWMKAGARMALRSACTRLAAPDRAFRHLRSIYPVAVNNAVLGAVPNNEIIALALERAAELDAKERLRRFRLGTHLLQEVTHNRSQPGMSVLEPEAFYPLGPEVSVSWFRPGSGARLGELLGPRSYVLHWYASLEARLDHPLDREWISSAREDVAFARLAWPWVRPPSHRSAAA